MRATLVLLAMALADLHASSHAADVRWSVGVGSSSDIWIEDGHPLALCALDALRVQAEWSLQPEALLYFGAFKPDATSRSKLADHHILSTLELVAIDVEHAPPGLTVASLAPTDRSLRELVRPDLLERAQQQQETMRATHEQLLRCEFDDGFCAPQLVGIRLPDVLSPDQSLAANHSVALEFAQPTNRPPAATRDEISKFVHFTEYIGDELAGEWSADGRVLHIRVLALTPELLKPLDALMQGLLQTSLSLDGGASGSSGGSSLLQYFEDDADGRPAMLLATDEGTFRIAPLGEYRVRLAISSSEGAAVVFVAESPLIRVLACGSPTVVLEAPVLQAMSERRVQTREREWRVLPSYSLSGVLSLAGQEGFVLPHSEIKMREPGSWSLSFWVMSTAEPTGSFRTLFFNGDGIGEMRTPSVWWKPDENRLVLRVSTDVSVDDGMDSEQRLPMNEWIHMGFRFRNCSVSDGKHDAETNASVVASHSISESEQCADARTAQHPWLYAMSFFVNGVKDRELFFTAPAIANSGPLHVGKGPWTDGMRGFVSDLRTFPAAITDAQLREEYLHERKLHYNFPSRTDTDEEDKNDDKHDAATTDELPTRVQYSEAERILSSRSNGWRTHPALQISYLLQRFAQQALSRSGGDGNADDSLVLTAKASIKSLQDSAYNAAIQLHKTCESRAWDVMLEAAELGHSQALRDVGEAHLYGSFGFPEACAAAGSIASGALPVVQDLSRARDELEAALKGGAWDAGKHLAVLFAAAHPYPGMCEATDLDEGLLPLANLTLGLYHVAAMAGKMDAFAILGRRYSEGDGVLAALDVGVHHVYHAAADASVTFHEPGKQPQHEMNRLYDALKVDIAKGQLGDDDELIQFQKLRAEQGDVRAMTAMGDLYYWGAHGLPRDHALAHAYYSRAARADHVAAQSALAGMLLKGEGGPQDNASAILWFEKAAARNHTRALNGLGFAHFYGTGGVSENKSLALEFFERAAANEEDGDSVFNAGYCHALGLGTAPNLTRAIHYYEIAATKFGHFDAIFEMGKIWMVGVDGGVAERSLERALMYLKAASDGGGRWGKSMRNGFDKFLSGEFRKAAAFYHEAKELGYPVATSNLAFLYDQRLLENDGSNDVSRLERETRAFHYLLKTSVQNGDKEVLVRIGDYHFYGLAGLQPDAHEALRWYSRASAEGVEAGAYSVGHMHEFGVGIPVNLERAQRYYERVIQLAPESREVYVVVRLALARLAIRKWVLEHAPAFAANFVASLFESSRLHQLANDSSNSTDAGSRGAQRRHFSELGGIALQDVWSASVYPFVLVTTLALIGFLYIRRSAS